MGRSTQTQRLMIPPCISGFTDHLWAEAVQPKGPYRRYCRRPVCGLIVEGPWDNPDIVTRQRIRQHKRLRKANRPQTILAAYPCWSSGGQAQKKGGGDRARKLRLIEMLYERDGAGCYYCGRPMLPYATVERMRFVNVQPPDGYPTLDHVVPRSKGGRLSANNVVVACLACNNRKSDGPPLERRLVG